MIIVKHSEELNSILGQTNLVLVDFFADWCGPCRSLTLELEKLQLKLPASLTIVKVNVDESPELAAQYQVRSIPALFFHQSGDVIYKTTGFKTVNDLLDQIYLLNSDEL